MSAEDPRDPYVDLSTGNARAIPSWRDPHLVISGPAGVIFVTPLAGFTTAGKTLSMTASADLDLAAQNALITAAKNGIELFTVGKLADPERPVGETGIRMAAASGPVTIQAQSDEARLSALQNVEIGSTTADVNIAAKEHVLLTALGAYLRLADGNIEIHAPGEVVFHAGQKILTGPAERKAGNDSVSRTERTLFGEISLPQ